ncbi:DUF871 domain-containing protein [Clostridium sp. MSJ-4]|uniref:DUF871 domain-containing protein n=1 Tax=Clostridium simiarum TaxID=2841506 RepID=A0ABS6F215_9CLOT|nr:DUF871 domain-containing protein [Clostridium simiarum]MBU5592549.1 DUF871 domain-containing protein [Clostridium simiarum]
MKKLGISVYPMHNSNEEIKNYIELAAKYNFKRIFTCLLSVEGDTERILAEFKDIVSHANKFGMEVIADISPKVFTSLNITHKDLSFFKEMGLYGIRLDVGFSGMEESEMTYNPQDLKIELNMSNGTKYVDNILCFDPKKENLLGCHNFYPHRYTGLSYKHFIKCSKQFKELGLRTAAFVSSSEAKYGPWPVSEGLCTLEEHRNMPIEVQAKHLWATELIDDIIIANAFASEEELKALGKVNSEKLTLGCKVFENVPEIERKIVLEEAHFNRGDVSDYVIRSTQSRVKYRGHEFVAFNTPDIKRGDLIIDTSEYGHYAGELQIALKDMDNSGRTNVVGRISEEEIFLLDYIEPWQKFKLEEK